MKQILLLLLFIFVFWNTFESFQTIRLSIDPKDFSPYTLSSFIQKLPYYVQLITKKIIKLKNNMNPDCNSLHRLS